MMKKEKTCKMCNEVATCFIHCGDHIDSFCIEHYRQQNLHRLEKHNECVTKNKKCDFCKSGSYPVSEAEQNAQKKMKGENA